MDLLKTLEGWLFFWRSTPLDHYETHRVCPECGFDGNRTETPASRELKDIYKLDPACGCTRACHHVAREETSSTRGKPTDSGRRDDARDEAVSRHEWASRDEEDHIYWPPKPKNYLNVSEIVAPV